MMNDFTKEELMLLKRALTHWVGENAGKIIKDKIQSMIDNYCDHKFEAFTSRTIRCKKCGSDIDHED